MSSRLGTRPRSRRSLRWPRLGDGPGARRASDDQEVHPGECCPALGTSGTSRDGQDADRLDVGLAAFEDGPVTGESGPGRSDSDRIGWVRLALASRLLAVRPAHLDKLTPRFQASALCQRLQGTPGTPSPPRPANPMKDQGLWG